MVNGYTSICLTKLDILDTLSEIKIGTGYVCVLSLFMISSFNYIFTFSRYHINNTTLEHFPGSITELASVEVEYKTLPGWETSTTGVRDFKQLPEKAQAYVHFIEDYLGIPIKWIGVGKGRESIINVN